MQCGKHQEITHTSSICSAMISRSFSRAETGASIAVQGLGCLSCGCLSAGSSLEVLPGRQTRSKKVKSKPHASGAFCLNHVSKVISSCGS